MEYVEYKGKNVDEAITNACVALGIAADKLDYDDETEGRALLLSKDESMSIMINEEDHIRQIGRAHV